MNKKGKRVAPPARRPSNPHAGLELDARRAERVRTVEALGRGRTPLGLIEVAEHGAKVAEDAVQQAIRADPPPPSACREGCDWCCHLTVGASVPEVVRLVEHLRQTLGPDELLALGDKVRQVEQQRREWKAAHPGAGDPRLPCVLLVNHRCTAYAARPLTCRGFNSSDASQCERFVKSPGKTALPLYTPQLRLTTFVLDGMRAGLSEAGLYAERVELTASLRIALEVPDAFARFLAGEAVFAAARLD